jgi:uncharacterized protein YfaS (alpha-2-macroglobulin family)
LKRGGSVTTTRPGSEAGATTARLPAQRSLAHRLLLLALTWLFATAPALAQDTASGAAPPAFSLATGETFTTKDRPAIYLTFQQIDHLDFRVYRVQDPVAFFAGLRDPHVLGSPEPLVPQEQTRIERIAAWKARWRAEIRAFFRRQASPAIRAERRVRNDLDRVVQRRTVGYTQFAQLPLLNPAQLVASWREMLPHVRDAEVRRLPLETPGAGVYVVEAVHGHLRAFTVVIVSDAGLLTKAAPGQLLVWAAHRFSGEPLGDCQVVTLADRERVASGTTGADGVFNTVVDLGQPDAVIAVARCGAEVVASDPGAWSLRQATRDLAGYVYTDRPIYRPGHTVHVKALLRWKERGLLRPFDRPQVEIVVADGDENVLLRQARPVDEFGGVHASLALPAEAALGLYSIRIVSEDSEAHGAFEVQEYRKPEFEVSVTTAERFVVQGGHTEATIRARYYFGQPVAGGRVRYVVSRSFYYSPWRWSDSAADIGPDYGGYYGDQLSEATATLDARGEARVQVRVPVDGDGRDLALRIEARIADASGREVAGQSTVYGTYGRFLLAASLDRYLQRPGGRATLRVRAVDYQGAAQPGLAVALTLERVTYPRGRYDDPARTLVLRESMTTDAEGRGEWVLTVPAEPGDYRVRAAASAGDRLVTADASLWVPGGTDTLYDEGDRFLELVFDRQAYAPGETAKITLRGEAFDGPVLVTKEHAVTSYHQVVRVRPGDAIAVPIAGEDAGDVFVSVAFLRDDRLYRAEKRLPVSADGRRLQTTVTPAEPVARPRDPGVLTVRTLDAGGQPVRAQVTLGVVDEAVYGVKPESVPDPVRFFYRREYSRVATQFSRNYSFVGYSGTQILQLAQRRRPFTLADFKADRPERPPVRRDFPDAIYWVADLVTGPDGTATVKVTYPDALTTWRVTARAATTDTRVGAAVARTTVTKDVILRVVPPRFLTEGDTVRVPVIAHNYLPDARTFDVTLAADGLVPLSEMPESQRLEAASNGEAHATWAFRAGTAGTATLTGRATAGRDGDAMAVSLPVLPYGARQEVGASGSLAADADHTVPLTIPAGTNPAARTIAVALAPSLAGSLLGALDYLTSFPYGCTEQTLSSFLPNLLVLRALAELDLAPAERMRALDRMAADGLTRLLDLQHDDGGWGWWKTDENHPFMTAYALYGLLEAERAGVRVDRSRAVRAAAAAARLYAKYPRAIPDLKAYLVWVLSVAESRGLPITGDGGWSLAAARDEVAGARSRMSDYGRALVVLALDAAKDPRADEAAQDLIARASQQGDLARWTSERDPLLDDWTDASVEATALAVQALAARQPDHPVLERAVRWLVLNRRGGYGWGSTKQTAMALLGLLDYLRARHDRPAPFTVEVFVNGRSAGTRSIGPEDWTRAGAMTITADAVEGENQVRLVKRGGGMVYWTATARYYDMAESFAPGGSRTLALNRRYFALAPVEVEGRIVHRETPFEGRAAPGDVILVRLAAAGAADWRYLVLEDPIPAGTEAVTTPEAYPLEKPVAWWWGSRHEYRDNRVVIFQQGFERGRYDYTYLLEVVTPGEYRAMPARLWPMYVPGVSATTTGQSLRVIDAARRESSDDQ